MSTQQTVWVAIIAFLGLAAFVWNIRTIPRSGTWPVKHRDGVSMFLLGVLALVISQPWFVTWTPKDNPGEYFTLMGCLRLITVAAVFFALIRQAPREDPLMRRPSSGDWKPVLKSMLLYACLLPLVYLFAALTSNPEQVQTPTEVLQENWAWYVKPAMFFTLVLATPLFEELVFRGLIMGGLRRNLPYQAAIVVSAGLFAAIHLTSVFPAVFLLGLLLGWTYERFRTIWAPVAVHVLHNGVTFLLVTTIGA